MGKGATKTVIDFSEEDAPRFRNGKKKSLTKKQIRARARRGRAITEAELETLYKPVEEWDEEELARGRPRASDGTFRGKAPQWITRKLHEEAMARFKGVVEAQMRGQTVEALSTVHWILQNNDVDERGRPVIPAGTKLDAAKFLIEHMVGKPTQRQEVDISVRLQALLATTTVTPFDDGTGQFALPGGAAYEGIVDADVVDDDEDSEDD